MMSKQENDVFVKVCNQKGSYKCCLKDRIIWKNKEFSASKCFWLFYTLEVVSEQNIMKENKNN